MTAIQPGAAVVVFGCISIYVVEDATRIYSHVGCSLEDQFTGWK